VTPNARAAASRATQSYRLFDHTTIVPHTADRSKNCGGIPAKEL
jgi:hypothetical protein